MSNHMKQGEAQMSEQKPPVVAHPETGVDPAWREKIERATAAHKEGKALRKSRQIAFTSRRSQHLLGSRRAEKSGLRSS